MGEVVVCVRQEGERGSFILFWVEWLATADRNPIRLARGSLTVLDFTSCNHQLFPLDQAKCEVNGCNPQP